MLMNDERFSRPTLSCVRWLAQANNFVRKKGLLPDNNDDDNDENDEEQA